MMKSWSATATIGIMLILPMAGFADTTPATPEMRSVWDGVYTVEQAQRGQELYLGKCANCHAETMVGNFPAPPLRGSAFTSRWSGQTVKDLHSRIRSTMPVDVPGSLSRQETFDIVSYLFQANGFPDGDVELAGMPVELQLIRITQEEGTGDER